MTFKCFSVTILTFAFAFFAVAQNDVAVLHGRNANATDFDAAVKNTGINADFFKCNDSEIRRFCANLGQYRLVLLDSLFNMGRDGNLLSDDATDFRAVRGFLERGGVLVATDAVYPHVNGWLDKVLGGAKVPKIGKCNSSQWAVLGHTENVEPVSSLRSFPNSITQGNSWPHYEKDIDPSWTVVANCSEGFPVVLTRNVGKGLVVLSAIRQPGEKILENNYAQAQLRAAGVDVKNFSMSPLAPGRGELNIELTRPAPKGAVLICEFIDAKGVKTTASASFTGNVARVEYFIKSRGELASKLYLSANGRQYSLCARKATLPPLLTIEPPAYRGIISTKRRLPAVRFRIRLAPTAEKLHGAVLTVGLYDSLSNCVFKTSSKIPEESKARLDTDFDLPLELPKELSDGEYEVRASLNRYNAKSSAPVRILAPRPAQTVIDEDNTFLINGNPFFPLGIYHPAGNYADISEIGFNTVQFWKWDMGTDQRYGVPMGLYKAFANGLRCLFESNHHGDMIYRDVVSKAGDHPAILMWYVVDEPAEGAERRMQSINDGWHKYDIHHPTYLLSCREDLFTQHQRYGDVFAFDPYGSKTRDSFDQTISWMKKGKEATEGRKALICVPWATPEKVDSIRPLAYAALVHDARGLIWYCWRQAGGGPLGIGLNTRKDCQEEYRKLLAEIKTLMPGLLSARRRTFEDGNLHGMVCGDAHARNKRFAILLNVASGKGDYELVVPELSAVKTVTDHFTGAQLPVVDGKIKVSLGPREVAVYRW